MSRSRLARLARKAYAHCKQKGWSRDWREAGCYLHLEASEFTEALRGKGDFEQEAADVLFVLLSTMEAHNIGVDWVLEILEQRLKDAPTDGSQQRSRNGRRRGSEQAEGRD